MARLIIKTHIKAPMATCFDLARSIDLHLDSMRHTNEKAVAGKTGGLIGLEETVTWEAVHFGLRFRLTSKVTDWMPCEQFTDEMLKGPFDFLWHRHSFETDADGFTIMTDDFQYRPPLGVFGKLADRLFLRRYMPNLLKTRNSVIKKRAELERSV